MAIVWNDDKMKTGVRNIDEQHKEWIRRFDEFDRAIAEKKGEQAIREALGFLAQYTEVHFDDEEEVMARLKCPAQEANRAAHDEFRRKVAEVRAWVEREGASSVEIVGLKGVLEDWLVNHICTIDIQLRAVSGKN